MPTPTDPPLRCALDHLVLACSDLETGARWLRERVGVAPRPGGRHPGFGTHNRLLQLGAGCYLELIAPDPAQDGPPRLFGLDRADLRAACARTPALVHWVVRATAGTTLDDPAAIADWLGVSPGVPVSMQRDALRWRLTRPDDADRARWDPGPRMLPTWIDWGDTPTPAARLPDDGLVLRRLTVAAAPAQQEPLARLAAILGTDDRPPPDPRLAFVPQPAGGALSAELDTPLGPVTLSG